jgi:peptidyl-prolyl cis-trans isomerase SurA
MRKTVFRLFFILTLGYSPLAQGQELLDGIAAIVGDEIILYTELIMATQQTAAQLGINPAQQQEAFDDLKVSVLQSLIDEKVVLAKAKEDTVTVEDHQVEAALDNRIEYFIHQMGSRENVESFFGAPIKKIKRDYREEVRKQLIVQQMQKQKLAGIQVSRREVETFYETMKDSLPERKEQVKLWHILMEVEPGDMAKRDALVRIREIQERIRQGEPFDELARQYSEDPGSASQGGDLGFVERGTLFQTFEEVAFQLEPGQISDVVETPVGMHLIQLMETRGDVVHVRHILIRLSVSREDEQAVLDTLLRVRERILAGESFEELAGQYSQDQSSREQGGDLGWLNVDDFQIEEFKEAVRQLRVGEIGTPFKTQFGYHLVKLEDRKEASKYSLDEDWEEIQMAALNRKQQKIFTDWVQELKKNVYIDIKEDMIK